MRSAPLGELIPLIEQLRDQAAQPATCLTIELESAAEDWLIGLITDFGASAPGGLLTVRTDQPRRAELGRIVAAARTHPTGRLFVHLRTPMRDAADAAALVELGLDIISIDLPDSPGCEHWNGAHGAVEALTTASRAAGVEGRARTWVVPRLRKCDATYPVVEGWFDRWLLTTGAAAIDALDGPREGERIAPLPLPAAARRRFDASAIYIRADGSVHAADLFDRAAGSSPVADASSQPLGEVWRRVLDARRRRGA